MSLDPAGIARRLCLPALLVLATGVFAQPLSLDQPQSLGEVARQHRAERQQSGSSARKVYTNEDLGAAAEAAPAKDAEGAEEPSPAEPAASTTKAAEGSANGKDETAKKEAELQKRTLDINQRYTDKILGIRAQIATAKQEAERLQHDQIESTNQFRSTNGVSPSVYEYQEQQRQFQQQIETQRNLIATLGAQLEDAQEAARHAGVAHAGE